jgi:hypothetical protein
MAIKKDQEPAGNEPESTAAPAAAASASAAPQAEPETKTPAEWAAQLGHTKPRDPRFPQSTDHVDPKYAVANKLYGWSEHAYDFQPPNPPFLISTGTYLAALATAHQFPATELTAEALTPAAAERLKDHKPARNLKVERAAKAAEAKAAEANAAAKKEQA